MDDSDRDAPRPEYPWQVKLPAWSPNAGLPEGERRKRAAAGMFEQEAIAREFDQGDERLVHDPEHDVFRFRDGRFAFSREHADWRALKEAGFFSEGGT